MIPLLAKEGLGVVTFADDTTPPPPTPPPDEDGGHFQGSEESAFGCGFSALYPYRVIRIAGADI